MQCNSDISHLRKDAKFCQEPFGRCYSRYHKEKRNAQNRKCAAKRYSNNRNNLIEYLSTHPCVDCGETDLVVLDFDHRDPKTKRAKIADVLGSWNWSTILSEIEKCDVRCANDHRRRTSAQFGWYKGGDADDTN